MSSKCQLIGKICNLPTFLCEYACSWADVRPHAQSPAQPKVTSLPTPTHARHSRPEGQHLGQRPHYRALAGALAAVFLARGAIAGSQRLSHADILPFASQMHQPKSLPSSFCFKGSIFKITWLKNFRTLSYLETVLIPKHVKRIFMLTLFQWTVKIWAFTQYL